MDADIKTYPSANHKLKWVLQSISGLIDPGKDRTSNEAKKEAALKAGIQKIQEFGKGIGYRDENGNKRKQNDVFIQKFESLLNENGVF